MKAIEATGLRKSYDEVQALDGLSFSVERGTVFGLLGPNGAGKSTTVKILTTLSRADCGHGEVGRAGRARRPAAVREAIGVVAQRSGADIQATGRENLRLQGQVFGCGGRELESRIDGLLEQFGLADAADRLVRTYSGGMQRRLDVALALVHGPEVLFLDEPTTGLDPEVRAEMWEEISRLTGEGLTVLLTTHYLEEADRLASRLAIVDRGRVVAEGTPDELKRELRGDAIHVELDRATTTRPHCAVRSTARSPAWARSRSPTGPACARRGRRPRGPGRARRARRRGFGIAAVTVARPSLDDVYLRYAGRTFSAAEAETENTKEEVSR